MRYWISKHLKHLNISQNALKQLAISATDEVPCKRTYLTQWDIGICKLQYIQSLNAFLKFLRFWISEYFKNALAIFWNTQCFSWNWLFIRKYISKYINISKTHWESQCVIEIFLYLILNFQCVFEIFELWYFKIFLKTHWAILLANALNAFNALLK